MRLRMKLLCRCIEIETGLKVIKYPVEVRKKDNKGVVTKTTKGW